MIVSELMLLSIDVMEADELEEGKIDGAVNIPLGQLIRKARHGDIDVLKKKKIITYLAVDIEGILQQMN